MEEVLPMKSHFLCLLALSLVFAGCGQRADREKTAPQDEPQSTAEEEAPPVQAEELIWVLEGRGSKQCEGGGISLEESAAKLTDSGVEVQESRCGVRTDRMYPSVCGGPTGEILLHLVDQESLDAALELGFDPADRIEYQHKSCSGSGGAQTR